MPRYYRRAYDLADGPAAAIAGAWGWPGWSSARSSGAGTGTGGTDAPQAGASTSARSGLAVGTAGLAGAVLIPALPAQIAFYCLANIGFSIAIPTLTAANADIVSADRRGLGFAALQFRISLAGWPGRCWWERRPT
ncbi:hypothetical protein [Actinomadura sp. BRA 177]|uniref:hypothetical protein n=1 Tax=Actinomadura sp. BRA 177 TaxID=2745202 RepID=UPI001594F13A|nr:hypothetical protein [Actinomadura sp. BRA 177]NVI91118.1 hypothetical protein [Actinomadura sp. BRA 177]